MTWKTIRLELARTPEFPEGSPRHGYLLRLPLEKGGLIDRRRLADPDETPAVHHFLPGVPDRTGVVIYTSRGWAFSYAPGDTDDERIFHLENHPLRPGNYVTVTEHGGEALVYRVSQVEG